MILAAFSLLLLTAFPALTTAITTMVTMRRPVPINSHLTSFPAHAPPWLPLPSESLLAEGLTLEGRARIGGHASWDPPIADQGSR